MTKDPWDWQESDLFELIRQGVQEGLELDYKRCDALQKTDGKKAELSKDISAFANSAGGVVVYGICEDGHVPTALDVGFDPSQISKEWLEQVINSRIQRRVDGIRVNQIALSTASPGKVAYVVSVPQSNRAPHQASDKRFYKRFNFESVPMEEYEIRDVANRTSSPSLDIELLFKPGGGSVELQIADDQYFEAVDPVATITNQASAVAEYAVVHIFLDSRIRLGRLGADIRVNGEGGSMKVNDEDVALTKLTTLWDRSRGLPLFAGITAEIPSAPLSISIPRAYSLLPLRYTIGAPAMETVDQYVFISVRDEVAKFIRPESVIRQNGEAAV
jgi:hypothetical protein